MFGEVTLLHEDPKIFSFLWKLLTLSQSGLGCRVLLLRRSLSIRQSRFSMIEGVFQRLETFLPWEM